MSIDWICTRKSAARMPSFSLIPRPREPIPPHHLVLSPVSSSVITPPDSLSMPNSNGFLINDSRVSLQLSCGETARVEHTNGNSSPLGETTRQRPTPAPPPQPQSPPPVHPNGPHQPTVPREVPSKSWCLCRQYDMSHLFSIIHALSTQNGATTSVPTAIATGLCGYSQKTKLENLR